MWQIKPAQLALRCTVVIITYRGTGTHSPINDNDKDTMVVTYLLQLK